MFKSKLVKALMLGVGMSAFMTNIAFAQMGAPAALPQTTLPATRGEVLPADQVALIAKQKDIDQYLFVDHASEIKEKGFMVNYTGVTGDVVEIGISPFTKENADYLYGLFGNDGINVVEFDQSVIYATSVGTAEAGVGYAEPGTLVDPIPADGTDVIAPDDTAVDGNAAGIGTVDPTVIKGSVGDGLSDQDKVYKTTAVIDTTVTDANGAVAPLDDAAAPAADPRVIYYSSAAPSNEGKDSSAAATSMTVLAIAGGAVLVGGAVMLSNKKKHVK